MSKKMVEVWCCDWCGHLWIIKDGPKPVQCPNLKCRKRTWDKDGDSNGEVKGATMKKNVCLELNDLAFPVRLIQNGRGRFTVEYGVQVLNDLTYGEACKELGRSIMHALSCDGRVDNGR